MSKTFQFGNGEWAIGKETVLAYNDENSNFKPLPFTFDRASSATVVNKQGLIETVGVDEPRIDFLNNSKGHLLLEPQRTNYVVYSETEGIIYGSNGWTGNSPGDISVTRNYGTTPFSGTELKSTRVQYTGSNKDFRNQFTAVTIQAAATMYVKGTSGETIKFGTTSNQSVFTLTGDWQKIEQIDSTSRSSSRLTINTFSGATARDIEIYAPQVEDGSYATSHIPTQGSAVTRSAESCYQENVTQVIGQSEGTMYIEFIPKDTSEFQILYQIRTTGSSNIGLVDIRLDGGNIFTLANDGGLNQFNINGGSYVAGTTYKIAVRYKYNDSKIYINGVSSGSDTNCIFTSSSLNQISFNANLSNFLPVADILDARLYNTALSDNELQSLTS